MSPTDQAAMEAARARDNFAHAPFDDQTAFIEAVLKWLVGERLEGRLTTGAPVTLVLYDFQRQTAAHLGATVKLRHGQAQPGRIHLCNQTLQVATVLPNATSLASVAAHEDMLVAKQYDGLPSVTFLPALSHAHVRIPCGSTVMVEEMTLSFQPEGGWATNSQAALDSAIGDFHASLRQSEGLGAIMFDGGKLRTNASITYRKAMYLYLQYGVGLYRSGFEVSAGEREVRVRHKAGGLSRRLKAVGTRSSDPVVAGRRESRALHLVEQEVARGRPAAQLSCLSCPGQQTADIECATAPNSLRHRHVVAA